MADQAVLKYLSIDTTFDPCYLSLDSTFKFSPKVLVLYLYCIHNFEMFFFSFILYVCIHTYVCRVVCWAVWCFAPVLRMSAG